MCLASPITCHQCQQPHTLPLITPPLCPIGWFAKTDSFVLWSPYNSTPKNQLNHWHLYFFRFAILARLEDTARYAGLLVAPAEGFGLRPRLYLPFGQKKKLCPRLFLPSAKQEVIMLRHAICHGCTDIIHLKDLFSGVNFCSERTVFCRK